MKIIGLGTLAAAFIGFAGVGSTASAQTEAREEMNETADGSEARPEPPKPVIAEPDAPGYRSQAGIGSEIAFAHAGVIELGGSIGLTLASGLVDFNVSPTVGYFIADNIQLSVLSGISYIKQDGAKGAAFARLLLEPSYHLPLNDALFIFMGLGFGGTYAERVDFGFAVAPRIGLKIMVGRSGILTPSISYVYSTNDLATNVPAPGETTTGETGTVATVSGALVANIGYTVMW